MLSAKRVNEITRDTLKSVVVNAIMCASERGEFSVTTKGINIPDWLVKELIDIGYKVVPTDNENYGSISWENVEND